MFNPVTPKVDFPKLEQEIIDYWKKNKIFKKTLEKEAPRGNWTFLDGPPFITGLPHYGNLLSSIPKDLFPRFKTMQGYRVRRVWGWDCHGLPAENKVEEELGIKRKKDIEEKIGVKKFIDACKTYVSQVSAEWEWYIDHIGRWVDFKNAYKTMDLPYMETVIWVFKQMYEKGLIYKGLRVLLYCPHCATPISNFEVAMDADNYKEITESTAVYKYHLKEGKDTYLLAWSTTPWNKLVTPALAVNPNMTYVKVKQGRESYILASSALERIIKDQDKKKLSKAFKGEDLIGKEFVPHYNFYQIDPGKKAFVVVGDPFVSPEEGTGVVTIAAYGEEDLAILQKNNVQIVMHLDEEGVIKKDVPKFGGIYYLDADKIILEDLRGRGLIYRVDDYTHTVPHCWRCGTRLYYAPQDAWYVDIQKLKAQLKKTNDVVNWFPKHFKYGRFLKSLEAAPDWNISRNRYWGSPIPVWECECSERFVPGSLKELEERSGKKIVDLHKPFIDEVTIICKKCGKKVKRVPEVLDSWIETGSAPYAERHYPFEKDLDLKEFFPSDFITEYTGQIRAWFYVLHVIATALFKSNAFKNVLVSGVILGTDGRKMSKNYGNYPDPKEMLLKYGGDGLRLYLLGSSVMKGEDIRISEEDYRNRVRGLLLILWNVYNFFISNANTEKWKRQVKKEKAKNVLDRWIMSRLNQLVKTVTESLENYDAFTASNSIERFVNNLSIWYVRRSRDRIGLTVENGEDKNSCYETLWEVLASLCQLLAPFTPFISEGIYQNLTGEESVHLANWPEVGNIDRKLELEMDLVRKICEMGHAKRKELGIKVRQPLAELKIKNLEFRIDEELTSLIRDELNIKEIKWAIGKGELTVELETVITPELRAEGEAREIVRMIQEKRKSLGTKLDEKIDVFLEDWPKEFEDYIKKNALIHKLKKGKEFSIGRYEADF